MKATPFFITGLPRSRTAWLANLFTTDTTICYHDRPFKASLCLRQDKRVGFSGSELAKEFWQARKIYPVSRWLVIDRDPLQAMESFVEFGKLTIPQKALDYDWRCRLQTLQEVASHDGVLRLRYEQLDDLQYVQEACSYLAPEMPFSEERFKLLDELRVEQHFDKALANRKELFSWQSLR